MTGCKLLQGQDNECGYICDLQIFTVNFILNLFPEALKVVGNPTSKASHSPGDSNLSSTTKLQGHFSGIILDN